MIRITGGKRVKEDMSILTIESMLKQGRGHLTMTMGGVTGTTMVVIATTMAEIATMMEGKPSPE